MDPVRWERVKEIFSAALEHDPAIRRAYIEQSCAGDGELLSEVASLIQAHEQTGDFIETPAAQHSLGLGPEAPPDAWIGRRVGAYRIVAEIGRGGMSEVFRGVRADDEYHKEVAVKILRPGYGTRLLVERFRAEKQILASLDHPNIARILDGGSTDEGLPYLVMDFIKGRPIDEYCRDRQPTLRERLQLFRSLCSAVQYVHQHLMVHGDLKCSNVLVTDEGFVRLLDFGVARLVQPAPGGPSQAESSGPIALTPEYASPEQLRGELVSTASDVYSLGVMLYKLLTGRLPYAGGGFPHEIATQIGDGPPPLPSCAALDPSSGHTGGYCKQLRGDLDSIVLRALSKDPAARYSSAEQLSEDIGRYMTGFPVLARPSGLVQTAVKFCRRHSAGVALMSLFVLTLIGGILAAGWQAHIARQERARAERHFDEVRVLAGTFMSDIHEAIQNLPGATPARHILVSNSLKYLDALQKEAAGNPVLERDLASAYEKLADVQGGYRTANLGDPSGAVASYRKALDIRSSLLSYQPRDLELQRDLLRTYAKLGEVLSGMRDVQGAITSSRSALRIAERLAAQPGSVAADRRNLGNVYVSLGWQLANAHQVERGLMLMNEGTAVFETLVDADEHDTRSRHNAAVAYGRMGEILIGAGRYRDALRMHTRQLEAIRKLLPADPTSPDLRTLEAYALLGIATVLSRQGSLPEALVKQTQAMNTLRDLFEADAKDNEARFNAAYALSETSDTLASLGQLRAAERHLRDALAIIGPAADAEPAAAGPGQKVIDARVLQGADFFRLGKVLASEAAAGGSAAQRAGRCEEARRWFDQSSPVLEAAERQGQWHTDAGSRSRQMEQHLVACRRQPA
jgi:serine/threonine protein kinase/tetratricopeptide (TPR) repeat protein